MISDTVPHNGQLVCSMCGIVLTLDPLLSGNKEQRNPLDNSKKIDKENEIDTLRFGLEIKY